MIKGVSGAGWLSAAMVLFLAVTTVSFIGACGGGGGGSEPSTSSDDDSGSGGGGGGGGGGGSGGGGAKFKLVSMDISDGIVPVTAPALRVMGETGSKFHSFMGEFLSFEMRNNSGNWISVYNGTDFLETMGSPGNVLADTLIGSAPPAGTYNGIRFTADRLKMKLEFVQGGTTYYTTAQSRDGSAAWNFSTNSADLGYVTYELGADTHTLNFLVPVVVTAGEDVKVYAVSEIKDTVSCDGATVNTDITYCTTEKVADTVLPDSPAIKVQFAAIANKPAATPENRENLITAFFNAGNTLIGASGYRPDAQYMNASGFYDGSAVFNGTSGSLDLTFFDADWNDPSKTFNVAVDFDCGAETYSGLAITNTPGTAIYTDYTLITTGVVNCIGL